MRWKPLLGKGKKEIECERARERRRREGAESTPPLLIRQFMALLFNKAIQGGEALWTRCSRGSIASEPLVWSVWGRLICSEDPLNCLSACVSSIDLHCVSSGPSPTFPQRPVSGQSSQSPAPVAILST